VASIRSIGTVFGAAIAAGTDRAAHGRRRIVQIEGTGERGRRRPPAVPQQGCSTCRKARLIRREHAYMLLPAPSMNVWYSERNVPFKLSYGAARRAALSTARDDDAPQPRLHSAPLKLFPGLDFPCPARRAHSRHFLPSFLKKVVTRARCHPIVHAGRKRLKYHGVCQSWRPQRDSNPCCRRERAVS
jgi:hypothetical protein